MKKIWLYLKNYFHIFYSTMQPFAQKPRFTFVITQRGQANAQNAIAAFRKKY
jgi:hypothetical protein